MRQLQSQRDDATGTLVADIVVGRLPRSSRRTGFSNRAEPTVDTSDAVQTLWF
jgi:hypothetical protein